MQIAAVKGQSPLIAYAEKAVYRSPERRQMSKWLINISGARPEILVLCPTERVKFVSLGWVMLIGSGIAGVSLWVALTTIIGLNGILAVPAAIAWGFVILGVDRWMVTSPPGGGSHRWVQLLPRLIVTLLVGVIVSAPLVLRVFQPEINQQVAIMQEQRYATFLQDAHASAIGQQVQTLRAQAAQLDATIAAGPHKPGYTQAVNTLHAVQAQLQVATARLNAVVSQFAAANAANTGLLVRLQALSQVEAADATLSASVFLLVTLFIVLEALPVTVRQLQQPGNYERVLAEAQRRELLAARRVLLGQTSASQPTGQGYSGREPVDADLYAIWNSVIERRGFDGTADYLDATEPELEPAESYEHTRHEDAALAMLEDTRASDWSKPPDGIALRWIDDDL
jgi:hypothetical protein